MFTPRHIKHSKLLLRHAFFIMSTEVETSLIINQRIVRDLTRALPRRSLISQTAVFLSCRPEWRHLSLFNVTTVRDLTHALPERSPVSSLLPGWWSRPAAHPPAAPHGVFCPLLHFGRNDRGRIQHLASSSQHPA